MPTPWRPYVVEVVTEPLAADGSIETIALNLAKAIRSRMWKPQDLEFLRPVGGRRFRFRMVLPASGPAGAMEQVQRWLSEASTQQEIEGLTVRRIEIYPPDDEDDIRQEWFEVADEVRRDDAEADRADLDYHERELAH